MPTNLAKDPAAKPVSRRRHVAYVLLTVAVVAAALMLAASVLSTAVSRSHFGDSEPAFKTGASKVFQPPGLNPVPAQALVIPAKRSSNPKAVVWYQGAKARVGSELGHNVSYSNRVMTVSSFNAPAFVAICQQDYRCKAATATRGCFLNANTGYYWTIREVSADAIVVAYFNLRYNEPGKPIRPGDRRILDVPEILHKTGS